MRVRRTVFLGAGVIAFLCVLVVQTRGEPAELFERRCGGCHSLDRNKEGPRLAGVYGRTAGSVGSFSYSDALRKSGITWTGESLEKWLTDPEQLVPDNNMAFRLENAGERLRIIEYLKEHSGR